MKLAIPAPLLAFWQQRQPRERLVLAVGGVALALIVLWLLVLYPLRQEQQRLNAALPQLRLELAAFKHDLGRAPSVGAALARSPLADQIAFAGAANGLDGLVLKVEAASADRATMRAKAVNWADGLRTLQLLRERGNRIERLAVRAVDGGKVDIDAQVSQ